MAYNNKLELEGNLCGDCEVIKDQLVVARMAVSRSRDGSKDPLYISVKLFTDDPANLDCAYDKLIKGTHIRVRGMLDVQEWETAEGEPRTTVCIVADEIAMINRTFIPLKKKPAEEDKPKGRGSRKPSQDNAEEDKPKGRGSRKPSQDNAEEDKPKGRGSRKPSQLETYDGDDDPPF